MIYKKYIAPDPNPDLFIHLSKVLNVYNLNISDGPLDIDLKSKAPLL